MQENTILKTLGQAETVESHRDVTPRTSLTREATQPVVQEMQSDKSACVNGSGSHISRFVHIVYTGNLIFKRDLFIS